jgi:hypothetical protein
MLTHADVTGGAGTASLDACLQDISNALAISERCVCAVCVCAVCVCVCVCVSLFKFAKLFFGGGADVFFVQR